MKELGNLSHLRKKLSIWNLRDVANAQDALGANLKGKKKIEELRLTWDGNTDDTQHERYVLEKLEPSENVKQLVITGYGGTTFPGWLGKSSFSNMVQLTLSGCKNCIFLPPLGQLPSLEELQIEGFDEVMAVCSEFYGSDPSMEKPFKSLKILKFKGMKKWQEWNTNVAGAFPHLAKLLIAGCPERDPQLKGMEQMSHLDPSSFTDIKIEGCSSFKCCQLDLLPQVSTLTIEHCLNIESLCIGERPVPALCRLTIRHCPNLVSFPKGGLAAPDLTSLVLEGCLYLKSLPENMHSLLPSLEDLQLISLPEVDSFPEGGLPSKLNTLCIVDCIKLKVCGLQALPSLSCFRFTGNDVESFDEETLPTTLTTLKIKRLGNLKSLEYKGLHHLTSLRKLSIQSCPKLESISEQALPSSLEYLHLRTLESLDYAVLQHITSLRKLKIWSCPKLASLQGLPSSLECLQLWDQRGRDYKELQHLTSLRTLILKSPKLESLPEDMLPSSLENLEILNLEDLEYKGLRHLTSLRKLRISSSPKLESVPGEGLPSSLVSLQISDLRNLKSLNYMGLQHFTSLRKLMISHSPKLESMPEEGLPSSLEYLKITDCPLLATRTPAVIRSGTT
uniref:R13L1/DRL21-like LRR repeat region domain-containing protein n=1 Tax=Populus trichocarpa TaxID=3694 RepID=A0A2K1X1W2_POPTR